MEPNGQTTLYAIDGEHRVYREWPDPMDEPLRADIADQVRERADATAVGVIWGDYGQWVITAKASDGEIHRTLYMNGQGADRYAHLASFIERLIGKRGITILFG